MQVLLAAGATVALVLASAKAHGRQVRLEREQQGYFRVEFGGSNPAAVEAIWRADRRIFWPAMAALSALGLAAAWAARDLLAAAFALAWAFSAAFAVAGLSSWVRMGRRNQGPLPWRRRAHLGSLAWWGLAAAAAALVASSWA